MVRVVINDIIEWRAEERESYKEGNGKGERRRDRENQWGRRRGEAMSER